MYDTVELKWLLSYLAAEVPLQISHGMQLTLLGPTQPYLAKNVGADIATINFAWSAGFSAFIVGAILSSYVFNKFLTNERRQFFFLAILALIMIITTCGIPLCTSLIVLLILKSIQGGAHAALCTCDSLMILKALGTKKSRPVIMNLHATIGVGFLLGTFLVNPFLPDEPPTEGICTESPNITKDTHENDMSNVQLQAPFNITASLSAIGFIIFLILSFKSPPMPNLLAKEEQSECTSKVKITNSYYVRIVMILVFCYYFITCGIERIFQPMLFTFGICGPLQLHPSDAVLSDSFYNGGFMAGRISSIIMAAYIRPEMLINISMLFCLSTSLVLSLAAGINLHVLYFGSFSMGYFVSWQFGSCYTWTVRRVDICNLKSSIFFVACGIGGVLMPPITGYIFKTGVFGGQMGMFHFNFVLNLAILCVYISLIVIARKARHKKIRH